MNLVEYDTKRANALVIKDKIVSKTICERYFPVLFFKKVLGEFFIVLRPSTPRDTFPPPRKYSLCI